MAQPAIRRQTDRLEDHGDTALDMMRPVDGVGAPRVGLPIARPLVRASALVRCVVGISELVIIGLDDAPRSYAQAAPQTEMLVGKAALQRAVEELVVTKFVGSDAPADLAQNRLAARLAKRGVIGARA